tara:strand:+ start:1011 stop:1559 length:549 start_codon:yes stop_codon:yes gene_type:complete
MALNTELYNKIKQKYGEFYRSFLQDGQLPMGSTEKGFWGYSIDDEVFEVFKKINLGKFDSFIDLGSGDGKVAIIASIFVKKAYGVEFDKDLIGHSNKLKEELGIGNVEFINDDFYNLDFSKFDIIYNYPDEPMERKLEKKLIKEMKGKIIVYGNHFHPKNLKRVEDMKIDWTKVGVYTNQNP